MERSFEKNRCPTLGCSQKISSNSGLAKAYAGLVTFNLEVTDIAKAYNPEIGSLEKLGLLVSKDTGSCELRICVSQTFGRSVTDKEATFVLLQIYNAKIRAFRGIFPLGTREVGTFDIFETQRILLSRVGRLCVVPLGAK